MIISSVTKGLSAILILLSLGVSIPLIVTTWRQGGGPWGFGVVGLPVLIPLSFYVLFAVAGLVNKQEAQRAIFIAAHIITLLAGIICLYVFPVYPVVFLVVPLLLATMGIFRRRHYKSFLVLMIALAIAANVVLLKWEIEFDRTVPFIELLHSRIDVEP